MDATNMSTNMSATMDYQDFIAAKVAAAPEMGFSAPLPLHDSLFAHQRAIVGAEVPAEAAAEAPEVANETGPAVATAKPKRAPRKAAKKEEAA